MFPVADPVLLFTILILIMLMAPILAGRLRVPDLVLLLLAGAVLGPNGLGVLPRNTAVTMLGSIGLLYILFLAGLELDLHRFSRNRQRSVLFGLLTFAIPQGLGTLAGRYVLGFDWTTSVLLASMFASHTLLAYPLASRLGIARTDPVAITVGATILTDTLALLVLAVIADSARGVSLGLEFWLGIGAGMILLVSLTWWGIPWLTRWFFKNVPEASGAQFLFVLVTVCACAYLSHFAKMEPIIGAFLAGAAFNRLIPEHSVLMNRVLFAGNTLFIPFFLISVGMLVDPRALIETPRSWFVAGTMVGTVITTKYIAAWLTGWWCGYDRNARHVMFGLSVVQAAATLAAVLVGYNLKIFDETILNGAIAMILVTCPLGSFMVDRFGRRFAITLPPLEAAPMLAQRLLVPVANPAFATKLLDMAFLLRNPTAPGSIHPVSIVPDEGETDEAVARAESLLAHCLAHAAGAGIPLHPSVRVDINVSDGIVRAAKELRASMVVTGWGDEHTFRERIFGSVMENLLETCPSRMLFCRLVQPLNSTRRLFVLYPPLAARRPDLVALQQDIRHLARQIGADIQAFAHGDGAAELREALESDQPDPPMTLMISESPKEARSRLFRAMSGGDMIVLPSERPSGALWSAAMDSLQELVATRFPNNNLIVAYPPLAMAEDEPMQDAGLSPGKSLRLCPVELTAGANLEQALQRMTATAFPRQPALAGEVHALLRDSAVYPMELSPGIVLIHAHVRQLEAPLLLVAAGHGEFVFSQVDATSRILLALVSPEDLAPGRHLQLLASLVRRFQDPHALEGMNSAASAGEMVRILDTGPA